ncbi:IS1182 family transposase [Chloroflexota bacterium]
MLRPKSPQNSFYGSYLYDSIVPQDHLLRKINEVVDFSFIKDIVKDRYRVDFGRPAEDPVYMFKLILLGYIYGHSDKQVVEHARVNMAYKYFLGLNIDDEVADDTTISFFRVKRLGEEKFQEIFDRIVQQCIDKGLVKGKSQMIDSTPIEANAAITSLTGLIKKCRSNVLDDVQKQNKKSAKRLGYEDFEITKQDRFTPKEEALEKEIEEAKKLLHGVTRELRKKRVKANKSLIQNLNLLEKAVADREEGTKDRMVSPSDPDARMGRKDSKKWTGYKGHVVVEEDSDIITAIETTPANKDDGSQLKPLLKQQEEAHDIRPEQLSADRAYGSGDNLETLADKEIIGYISLIERTNPTGMDLFKREDFIYDPVDNTMTCPSGCVAKCKGREMVFRKKQRRKGFIFYFNGKLCANCQLKPLCFTGDSKTSAYKGRSVRVNHWEPYYQQMKARMESEEGKAAYRNRYKIERKIADLVRYCGMRRSRYRGLERTKIHTLLAATVSNVKRMARVLWEKPEPIPKPVLGG